jgi:hypothetical protein
MSEGQSQRSVASSAQHRQEAEVSTGEERERAAAEIVVTAAMTVRLTMAELAAARARVEAATATDAACAVVAELEALHGSSISNSVSINGCTDDELKLAREAAREQTTQWAAVHPQERRGGSPDGRGHSDDAPGGGARGGCAPDGDGSPDRRERAGG